MGRVGVVHLVAFDEPPIIRALLVAPATAILLRLANWACGSVAHQSFAGDGRPLRAAGCTSSASNTRRSPRRAVVARSGIGHTEPRRVVVTCETCRRSAHVSVCMFPPHGTFGCEGACGMIDSQSDTQSSTCCFTVKTYALPRAARLASLQPLKSEGTAPLKSRLKSRFAESPLDL